MPDLKREFLTPTFVLAVLGWLMLLFTIVLFAFVKIPTENRDVSLILVPVVVLLSKDSWSFFFSTTRQSEAKTQMIADQSKVMAAQTQLAIAGPAPDGMTRVVDLAPGEKTELPPGHTATVSVDKADTANPQS